MRIKKITTMLLWRLLLGGLLFLIVSPTVSGQPRFSFETLSLEEGISHNMVYCIIQDRQGIIWLGSMYGLIRYDGHQYTRFRNNPQDPQSLSHNDVVTIFEDSQQHLWIGTWGGGLNRFDRKTATFQRFLASAQDSNAIGDNTVWSVAETEWEGNHTLWFATARGGIYTAEVEANSNHYRFQRFSLTVDGKQVRTVQKLLVDSDSTLWFAGSAGLLSLSKSDASNAAKQFESYFPRNFVRTVYEDASRRLWVGTAHDGVHVLSLDDPSETIHRFKADLQNQRGLASNSINAIVEDKQSQFWIATENGLSTIHEDSLESKRFINSRHNARQSGSLSSNQIISLCSDVSGMLWIGSYLGGVNRYAPWKNKFELVQHNPYQDNTLPDNHINALMQTHDKRLWVASSSGLSVSEKPISNSVSNLGFRSHTIYQKYATNGRAQIRALCETWDRHNGRLIWVAWGNKLLRIAPDGSEKFYRHNPKDNASLSSGVIKALLHGEDEDLWIATSNGLNRMNITTGKVMRYVHRPNDNSSLAHSWTLSLYKDEANRIWVGSYGGLSRYDGTSDKFINYRHRLNDPQTLPSNYIYAMHQASNDKLWVGTSAGLSLLDPESGICESYGLDEGLANEVICAIADAGEEQLWLSTHQGLSLFNPENKGSRNYDVHDGLQGNMFNQGVMLTLSDGSILFGGINGLNRIPNSALVEKDIPSPMVLNSVSVNGKIHSLTQNVEIMLSWDEREPQFNYALLDYTAPQKNRYAYRLLGWNDDWVLAGNKTSVGFGKLPPGEYVFEVRGTDSAGKNALNTASIKLTIAAPFWLTSWFYLLAIAIVFSLAYGLHHYRLKQQIRQSLLVQRARSLERSWMRDKTSRDYHDQMGHQLTKISLYSALATQNLNGSSSDGKMRSYLDKIAGAAERLGSDSRDFIWALNPENDTLYDLVRHLNEFGTDLFNDSPIEFHPAANSDCPPDITLSMDWRRHVTLLVKEAFHNVLKHSKASRVKMEWCCKNGLLRVAVVDNGIGCGMEVESSGNGLDNMQQRAEKLGGKLVVEAAPNVGTSIIFLAELPHEALVSNQLANKK